MHGDPTTARLCHACPPDTDPINDGIFDNDPRLAKIPARAQEENELYSCD